MSDTPRARKPSRCRTTLAGADQITELAEQVIAVMWAGRRFGMILHAERGEFAMPNSFDRLIVQVDVRDFDDRPANDSASRAKPWF